MVAPGVERPPFDILGQSPVQTRKTPLHITAERAVVGQHQEALLGIEMIEQAQTVEQDERLTAAGHAVDNVELEVVGQRLAFDRAGPGPL